MKVTCSGDIGDLVYLMGILHGLEGGPHSLLIEPDPVTRQKTIPEAERFCTGVKSLAESQSYISECRVISKGDHPDWRSQDFRRKTWGPNMRLMGSAISHLITVKKTGFNITGDEKWITIDPSPYSKDRIVIARSPRYRNNLFPWGDIVKHYGWRLMFVGLEVEWKEFIGHFGYVEYVPTQDMYEVARLIAGSRLIICNQSSPNAIAEGLKHNHIQETCIGRPDCIFKRDNVQHVYDGRLHLPGFDGDPAIDLKPAEVDVKGLTTVKAPPGKWRYPGVDPNVDFDHVVRMMKMNIQEFRGASEQSRKEALLKYTLNEHPNFWKKAMDHHGIFSAMKDAGYTSVN